MQLHMLNDVYRVQPQEHGTLVLLFVFLILLVHSITSDLCRTFGQNFAESLFQSIGSFCIRVIVGVSIILFAVCDDEFDVSCKLFEIFVVVGFQFELHGL